MTDSTFTFAYLYLFLSDRLEDFFIFVYSEIHRIKNQSQLEGKLCIISQGMLTMSRLITVSECPE